MTNSANHHSSLEHIPSNDSSKPEEENLPPTSRPHNLNEDESTEDEEIYLISSDSDTDSEDDYVISDSESESLVDVDQIQLREEFNEFAAFIREGRIASHRNITFWMNLSQTSSDLYLDAFTWNEFEDLIALFLDEIRRNTDYKYPCLAILAKWVLNLRRRLFDFYGSDIFGHFPIVDVFERELNFAPNHQLLLATNMLRMPMI